MHYYHFNIGDYASHTRYLTPMQDLIYRRLLDLYYLHEKAIPKDNPSLCIGLNECLTDVQHVLNEFFIETDKGWINKRADQQIADYKNKQKSASAAGKKSGEVRRASKTNGIEQPLNKRLTDLELTNKHKPLNTNHKPNKLLTPDGVLQSVWEDFVQQRKDKKAPITETALKGIDREARKAGISLNDALQEICARGWTGFKAEWILKDQSKKTEHQLRQDATARVLFGETSVMEVYDANNTRLLG